jgi:hypothetical protein
LLLCTIVPHDLPIKSRHLSSFERQAYRFNRSVAMSILVIR